MNRTYIQHYKSLFTLGIPIVIGQVGVIILGFADTLMIGHHSTNELAAASFVTICSRWPSFLQPAFRMA